MGKRFENSMGVVMMMTLKGMHQVHSTTQEEVHLFKTTSRLRALNNFQTMENELRALQAQEVLSGNSNDSMSSFKRLP